jgi:hypothetical protein
MLDDMTYHDDSAPGELAGIRRRERRSFFRFDPTVSTGTLLQIGVVLTACTVAWGQYQRDQERVSNELAVVKRDQTEQRAAVREQLRDLSGDMKEVTRALGQVQEGVAVLKARADQQSVNR